MSSVMNPGTNYFGSNPLGQKVRSLETLVETLRKKVESLEKNGGGAGATVVSGPPGPAGPPGPPWPPWSRGPDGLHRDASEHAVCSNTRPFNLVVISSPLRR